MGDKPYTPEQVRDIDRRVAEQALLLPEDLDDCEVIAARLVEVVATWRRGESAFAAGERHPVAVRTARVVRLLRPNGG